MPERKVKVGSSVGPARPPRHDLHPGRRQAAGEGHHREGRAATRSTPAACCSSSASTSAGGEEVVLAAEGEGAEAALDELEALLQRDLDKEE